MGDNPSRAEGQKLLTRVREAMRVRHLSPRTEEAYTHWIRRYILFHRKRHPAEMGEVEINAFLTDLAVHKQVSPSTQTQALCALLFLYRTVLEREIGELEGLVRAKRRRRLPVVLTRDEVRSILSRLSGINHVFLSLLYGTGMRLMEGLRLRVKDVDFGQHQITIRDGKGGKDRTTMLPSAVESSLQEHLRKIREIHRRDLQEGFGRVHLPYALAAKYRQRTESGAGSTSFRQRSVHEIPRPAGQAVTTSASDRSSAPSARQCSKQASRSPRPSTR